MAKEKRTYEADARSVHSLKLQPLHTENGDLKMDAGSRPGGLSQTGFSMSRDLILRLIDNLKDK